VIGIGLGTTFVSVSATIDGRVHILPFPDGSRAMPSVVAFPRRGEIVVGAAAREKLARDPRHAVASAKRLIGRKPDDKEVQSQLGSSGHSVHAGPTGELVLDMWGEPLAIPQLCGYLLEAARVAAEAALDRRVDSAVLTVPVSFGPERIEMLRRAARLAHLQVLAVIDEPSAAAVANRFRPESSGLVGIYDFGGGTFDFSVVDTSAGDFKVVTAAGDSWLGGDDFDLALADTLANLFWRAHNVDLRQRVVEWQQVLFAVEQAKRDLSLAEETHLVVRDVVRTASGTSDLSARLHRTTAEKLWQPLIDRSLNTCRQTLALVGLAPSDLTAIYLSGGTTHIPLVRRAIHQFFGTAPTVGVPPDYAVCLGAGVQAAQIEQVREPTLSAR
jgi:molecular chaperone DnaK